MEPAKLNAVAAVVQVNPEAQAGAIAELLGVTTEEVMRATDQLLAHGLIAECTDDPHGITWASEVEGPTDGPIGRARLQRMLAAVQKATLVAIAIRVKGILDGTVKASSAEIVKIFRAISEQLHLERGELTSNSGGDLHLVRALGSAYGADPVALQALIDRLAADRAAVQEGRRIPGVS
jgi:hypothetical protein